MAKSLKSPSVRPPPRLRRAYFECRFGQLHVHNAIPGGGGFDELTTLICLHGAGATGRVFASVLAELGAERSVYALDLPGSGESDAAPGVDPVEAAAQATADFLDSMRIRQADLLALAEGIGAARRIAAERPGQFRRVALWGDTAGRTVALSQPLQLLSPAEALSPQRNVRLAEFLA